METLLCAVTTGKNCLTNWILLFYLPGRHPSERRGTLSQPWFHRDGFYFVRSRKIPDQWLFVWYLRGRYHYFKSGQKHQALCTDPSNPATEFFVGLCDVRFGDFPENYLPLHLKDLTSDPATQSPILHTSGELRQKLFKICTAMSVENDVCRSGRYIMLKSYLMQCWSCCCGNRVNR